jgi:hypothetical protein
MNAGIDHSAIQITATSTATVRKPNRNLMARP